MANSSNHSSLALVTLPGRKKYDVFITFRGEDTRNNFTDHLFDALQRKNIFAFRDDTNLLKGKSIGPELLRAIEDSQVYVAVLSRKYATSTWCLEELEKILECVRVSEKQVFPVFYGVDPSVVRKQSGIYGKAFVQHEQRFQQDYEKVLRWREALTQVANLSGWDLRNKQQSQEIKEIVQRIIDILDCKSPCVSKDLVGIDSPMQKLEKLLLLDSVDDRRVIGICGMGGIGKTALATTLYAKISNQFDAHCFIEDVNKQFSLHYGPLIVQKQILFQTLGEEPHQMCNHYDLTNMIRRRLGRQRALVILDNVDKVEQLEKIGVYREWLGGGSRIIIISRNEHIFKVYGVDEVYKVPLLDWTNSLQLLCRNAFKLDHILSSYERLVYSVLHYVDGLPLAIEVLGSFLCGRDISEWESALTRLRDSPDKDGMDVLRLSFDGLEESEKEIFLHIACFFNKKTEKYVKNVLNCCGFYVDIGLRILIDKSLISVVNGCIVMHGLLEELGKKIVQENSSKEPIKWSRLWLETQIDNVMLEKMENHVKAIVLERFNFEEMVMKVEHLSRMKHLRLLIIITFVTTSGSLSCLPNELRYVHWRRYPFKDLPSSFQPNQLVELILVSSRIEQLWEGKKYLPNLRNLDLRNSINLIEMPHFGEFPNLEQLNLAGCIKLMHLDPSIGMLRKLVYLNLKGCKNLVYHSFLLKWHMLPYHSTTPTNLFPSWHSLRELDISFCSLPQIPDAIGCLYSLERLNLGGNNFVTVPSLRKLSKLVYLNLEHCKLLITLPKLPSPPAIKCEIDHSIANWYDLGHTTRPRLRGLFIFNCPKLGETESWSSITFSWMIRFIQANPQLPLQIVTLGSEIPSWFKNWNKGNSIQIDSSPVLHDRNNNNNIIGCVFCAVFFMNTMLLRGVKLLVFSDDGRNETVFPCLKGTLLTVKSHHIWLTYFPFLGILNEVFYVEDNDNNNKECLGCGYRWVYKEDLQEFNLTKMNHILAIEDEA